MLDGRGPGALAGLGFGLEQHALLDQCFQVGGFLGQDLIEQRVGLVEFVLAAAAREASLIRISVILAFAAGLLKELRILGEVGQHPAEHFFGVLA